MAALTMASAVQIQAGILDWLKGSSPAKESSVDPISSFKSGIAKLEDRKADIFGSKVGKITYDVKNTDSALNPMVGFIRVEEGRETDESLGFAVAEVEEFQLLYSDGKWVVNRAIFKLWDSDKGDSPGSPLSLTNSKVQQVQHCFD